jgi:hypothetical protein
MIISASSSAELPDVMQAYDPQTGCNRNLTKAVKKVNVVKNIIIRDFNAQAESDRTGYCQELGQSAISPEVVMLSKT